MNSRLSGAVCALTLAVLANPSHAATVNPIIGLDIGGTLYDVTFHDTAGDSFNRLWDADGDGVFGGGSSLFNTAPTFWGDWRAAETAAFAIVGFLGDNDQSTALGDAFYVPYEYVWDGIVGVFGDEALSVGEDFVDYNDLSVNSDQSLTGRVFVSFAPSVAPVPVPSAVWLFGSGLLALVGTTSRKTA